MKNRLFTFILSVCISLCLGSLAFAAIDLDLEDDSSGTSESPLGSGFITIMVGYDMNGSIEDDPSGTFTHQDINWPEYDYTMKLTGGDEYDVDNGISISLELGKTIQESISLGIGASYQLNRAIDEKGSKAEFQFIPIYGFGKFWMNAGQFFPYAIVHIGYNFLKGNEEFKNIDGFLSPYEMDLSGGIYWGIGGGIILSNGIQIQLLYSVNNGSGSLEESESSIDEYGDPVKDSLKLDDTFKYTKITISAGFNF